jgi:exodeoxyribonuclease-1
MTYVFFDTETTGLSPAFDQIVHFAAVRTDHDLNELDRFQIRSRLQPHVVPHPSALLINGLPIDRLLDRELPSHGSMVAAIRERLLDWAPAIFAGFNSIGYDEEMLRHSLFQTLYPAYLTSAPGNGRADAYGLVQTASALTPGCIAVPLKTDGRRDFRLSSLVAANGLDGGQTHDAIIDVVNTIQLCRLVKDRSPEAWQRFVRLSNRATVTELVEDEAAFVLTEFFGGEPHHRAVVCIGTNRTNKHGRFCIDLAHDPDKWRGMSDDQVRTEIACKGTPLRRVRVNAAPTLTPLEEGEGLVYLFDAEQAGERARRYRESPDICARLIGIYTSGWSESVASIHPEQCLYSGGFFSDPDSERCWNFHSAPWTMRSQIAAGFDDPRLRFFAQRIIYGEHRSLLAPAEQLAADLALAARLLDDSGGPLTLRQALAATDDLMATSVATPNGNLGDFRAHLVQRISGAEEFRDRHRPTATRVAATS